MNESIKRFLILNSLMLLILLVDKLYLWSLFFNFIRNLSSYLVLNNLIDDAFKQNFEHINHSVYIFITMAIKFFYIYLVLNKKYYKIKYWNLFFFVNSFIILLDILAILISIIIGTF